MFYQNSDNPVIWTSSLNYMADFKLNTEMRRTKASIVC